MADRRPYVSRNIRKLNEMIESRYGFSINFDSSVEHLVDVCRHYDELRTMLLSEYGEAEAYSRPEYAKAVLVSEAIRMFLREIAPRRLKKNRKK